MLSLKESRAVCELAGVLYDFLPGSGNAAWKGHVSFKSVAEKVGVGNFWQPGSKLPMLTSLLEQTLEFKRDKFEALIVEVIRAGLTYRQKNNDPITPEEINKINGLILEIGFKFPDLWDTGFITSLHADGAIRAEQHIKKAQEVEELRENERIQRSRNLDALKQKFLLLHTNQDRQSAGLQLEEILNQLFLLHDLAPREPFRVVGEQIDGSFELDHEIYLFEAKWHKTPRPVSDLYIFREKIEGKSKFTRGVFFFMSGTSIDAIEAIIRGKQPNFFVIDGCDIMILLEDHAKLVAFLRRRQRLLAEEGRICVPFSELQL